MSPCSLVTLSPYHLLAAEPLLRGPGFYFSLPKLVTLLVLFFLWIATCSWVDRDARVVKLPAGTWNLLFLGAGLVGLVVIALVPVFFLTLVILLAIYLGAGWTYLQARDRRVPAGQRLLTGRFLGRKGSGEPTPEEEEASAPLRFLGPADAPEGGALDRVAQAESLRGFKTARKLVQEAFRRRAGALLLEPERAKTAVRFRIDGIPHDGEPLSRALGEAVLGVFKTLGNLDLAEKRKPQEGRFGARVEGRLIDLLVTTSGTVAGEKMQLRLLDRGQQLLRLDKLGMPGAVAREVQRIATGARGLLLVCGPAGSGKKATLFACLGEIDLYQKHAVTLEDRIEHLLPHVTQVRVAPRSGKTFAGELPGLMRQSADVILVEELRDRETAELACQAAQSGHLVLTTLAAPDAVAALEELVEIGLPPALLAASLQAVLAQRLVRLLCPECKVRYKPNPDLLRKANLPVDRIKYFYRPPDAKERDKDPGAAPCPHCGGTGYHGQQGIFELLVVTDPLREMLREKPNFNAVRQEALRGGMRPLQDEGLALVMEGVTSVQEIMRVMK